MPRSVQLNLPVAGASYTTGSLGGLASGTNAVFNVSSQTVFGRFMFRSFDSGNTAILTFGASASERAEIYQLNGVIWALVYRGGSAVINTSIGYYLSPNVWYSIGFTNSASGFAVFVNGAAVYTSVLDTTIAASVSNMLNVGSYFSSTFQSNCYFNDIVWCNTAITPTSASNTIATALAYQGVLPSNYTSYWKCQEVLSATTASLTSGTGPSLTVQTGGTWALVGPSQRPANRNIPYSVNFDGSTTKIVAASATPTNFGTGDFTIAVWAYRKAGSGNNSLFNNYTPSTGIYWQFESGAESLRVYLGAITARLIIANAGYLFNEKWTRLVLQRSSNTVNMFANGVLIGTATGVSADNCSGRAAAIGDTNFYKGRISQFRAWNRALSASEIMQEWQGTLSASAIASGLVTEWLMTEGSGTSVADTSGNSNTGTITAGSGGWVTDSPMKNRFLIKNYPYSLNFNGSTQYGVTSGSVPMSSATKLTVATWVKINATTAGPQIVIGTINNAASNNGWEIEYDNNAVLPKAFVFLCNRGGTLNYAYTVAMQPGYWYRIVGVYDGSLAAAGRTKIYVNGVLPANSTFADTTTGGFDDAPITLGDRSTSGFYLSGKVAQAKVLPGVAWTPTDVWNDFCDFTTTGTPVANYNFTNGSGTSVTDSSGGGYNIGLVNTPTWGSTDVPRNSRTQIPKQNLLLYSEQFDQAAWFKQNVTVSANATTAPDGNITADLVYPSSTGTFRSVHRFATNAKLYYDNTVSVYAKAAGINYITFVDFMTGSTGTVWFNLSNGTIGTSATGYTGTITDVGGGWYRCSVKGKMGSSPAYCQIILADADNSATATTSGTNGVYLWGAQWNTTTQATDYQVTTSAAVNTGTPRIRIT